MGQPILYCDLIYLIYLLQIVRVGCGQTRVGFLTLEDLIGLIHKSLLHIVNRSQN